MGICHGKQKVSNYAILFFPFFKNYHFSGEQMEHLYPAFWTRLNISIRACFTLALPLVLDSLLSFCPENKYLIWRDRERKLHVWFLESPKSSCASLIPSFSLQTHKPSWSWSTVSVKWSRKGVSVAAPPKEAPSSTKWALISTSIYLHHFESFWLLF